MTPPKSAIKTNVIYGLITLVPLAVIILLLAKMVEILEKIAEPLGLRSATSAALAVVIAILLFLVICYGAGAMVRTRIGSMSFEWFENAILVQIPGYAIVSNILKGFTEKKTIYPAAIVRLFEPGTAVFGFVMEEGDNGLITVFVPSTPVMTVGSIHVVESARVTIIENGALAVSDCISQWGIGSQKIIGDRNINGKT